MLRRPAAAAGAVVVAAAVAVGAGAWPSDDDDDRPAAVSAAPATQAPPLPASPPVQPAETDPGLKPEPKPPEAKAGPAPSAPGGGRATAGDLVVSGIDGYVASSRLLRRVRAGEVAGVILMGTNIRTVPQVRALTASIRRAAAAGGRLPPLVMTDQEGGTVKRFRSARPDRSARAMAAQPLETVERSGRLTGEDLRERGVNVDLAPVVDVPDSATNFLTTRAFARDPDAVARNACAFARGLVAAGVVPTLKHFPGLGGAGDVNTDEAGVTIDRSRSRLRRDWKPYATCADDRTLTMISSALYPALTGNVPAVLSPATYAALRTVAPGSATITDALEGGALARETDVPARAVRAGADLLLYTGERNSEAGHAALASAIRDGRIGRSTLRERARRVRALRRALSP